MGMSFHAGDLLTSKVGKDLFTVDSFVADSPMDPSDTADKGWWSN